MESEKQSAALLKAGEINRKIISIVVPITIDNVLQMIAGIVSMGMIGRIDALSISALGISMRITQIIWALFKGITTGATVFVAQYYGAGEMCKVKNVIRQTLFSGIALVLVLQAVVYTQASRMLMIFNPDPELLGLATEYVRTVSFGLPFLAVMLIIGGVLQGMGNAKTPMLITIVMNIVNILAGYVLIFGRFGIAPMGVRGAALATVASQGIAAVLGFYIIFNRNGVLKGSLNLKYLKADRAQIKEVYRVGLPTSMESIFWQLAAIILTRAILTFGETAFAAHQLGLQAESISYTPAAGFGVVATALIGQALGARDKELARLYLRQILKGAMCITTVCVIVLVGFPRVLMSALTDNREIIGLSSIYLMLMGSVQFFQNTTGVLTGAMRGAGFTKVPMMVAGIGLWGVRVPLALLMTYVFKQTIVAIWIVMCVDLIFRFLVCLFYYRSKNIYDSHLMTDKNNMGVSA
ncbi:MAG TPA: MATE family efflux transporter [Clostridia bacterium]|nr:MATE family efflux transporter [Clostridia bacterium]